MSGKPSQCRIIAGKWRGRKIDFVEAEGLRPTTDRIRETVFNWLQPYLSGSRCLDAFAGSGVLGFEALSRGAVSLDSIEINRGTVKRLESNAANLDAGAIQVHHADTLMWLRAAAVDSRYRAVFDLVFLDPPFAAGVLASSAALLADSGVLREDALIYVEHAIDADTVTPKNWERLKQKNAGQVCYSLYQQV